MGAHILTQTQRAVGALFTNQHIETLKRFVIGKKKSTELYFEQAQSRKTPERYVELNNDFHDEVGKYGLW